MYKSAAIKDIDTSNNIKHEVVLGENKVINAVFSTTNKWTPFMLRLALGIMILPHGLQKTVGWFGGYGFEGTMGFFTGTMGIPWVFAVLAIAAESLGGLGLILGLGTRIAAFGVGFTMLVAALTAHLQFGFFMNWMGTQKGEGIEFHLLAIAIAVALVIQGGGKYAVDRLFTRRD